MLRTPWYLSDCPEKGLLYKEYYRHVNNFGSYGLHCAIYSCLGDDYNTAESIIGYIFFMVDSPVNRKSKLQSTVSTLTCENEYTALFEAPKEYVWIRNFLSGLHKLPPGPILILENNTGRIK